MDIMGTTEKTARTETMTDYDPREAKLPKWAVEVLADARRKADLGWPTTERPEPDCAFDVNGQVVFGNATQVRGKKAYTIVRGYGGVLVEPRWFDDHGYVRQAEGLRGFGSRANGEFWLSERQALIGAWWFEAERVASRLHRIAQMVREAGDVL